MPARPSSIFVRTTLQTHTDAPEGADGLTDEGHEAQGANRGNVDESTQELSVSVGSESSEQDSVVLGYRFRALMRPDSDGAAVREVEVHGEGAHSDAESHGGSLSRRKRCRSPVSLHENDELKVEGDLFVDRKTEEYIEQQKLIGNIDPGISVLDEGLFSCSK